MSRGNRRTAIFKDESDYLEFLEYIKETRKMFGFKLHSLCLMTNHFHIALGTGDIELWKIMHKLLLLYAANYNIKYNLTGHLFENRYTACLIENERYFLEVSRYIHLNPVKVQMVRAPLDYEYSSYGLFVDSERELTVDCGESKIRNLIADLVETDRVLTTLVPVTVKKMLQNVTEM